jgi:hypothetical protein
LCGEGVDLEGSDGVEWYVQKSQEASHLTRYESGAAFERTIKRAFEANGFTCIRSAGSKGKVDLIAFNSNEMFAIQCKRETNRKHSYRDEMFEFGRLVVPDNCSKQLWIKRGKMITVIDVMTGTVYEFDAKQLEVPA